MPGHTDFHPLLNTLPVAEVRYLLGYLKGQSFDAGLVSHAAVNLCGYVVQQTLVPSPIPPPILPPLVAGAPSVAGKIPLEVKLEVLCGEKQMTPSGLAAFDWKGLLKDLVEVILRKVIAGS